MAGPPHFLLLCEATPRTNRRAPGGRWRFLLESLSGEVRLEAAHAEPDVSGERLELLAVVRGLEALDQPSRVTLVTRSRNVARGLRYGLDAWRDSDWQWERFGRMMPVKNGDLWRRIDGALRYHAVECRTWRLDPPAGGCVPAGRRQATGVVPHPHIWGVRRRAASGQNA